jgi:SAM-dependent methyltransferase
MDHMSWSDLDQWWLREVREDPAYESMVTPALLSLLRPEPGRTYLDLGCGEGRVMRSVVAAGANAHGVEQNSTLAGLAALSQPTVVARLPDLSFLASDSYAGAYLVLVLEHIADHRTMFAEAARVVRVGGVLALVMNHPIWTAPRATPITDGDGEVLWRSGNYFGEGEVIEPAGEGKVVFHHRPLFELMNSAASAGWALEEMIELPHHDSDNQSGIPRLLACRWSLIP